MLLRHAHTEGIQRLYLPSFMAVISEKIVIEIIIVCAIFFFVYAGRPPFITLWVSNYTAVALFVMIL